MQRKFYQNRKQVNIKKNNTINDNYWISIIDIKFYFVYCLFMVVFVIAKNKYN